jgi:hypothetical protein
VTATKVIVTDVGAQHFFKTTNPFGLFMNFAVYRERDALSSARRRKS